MLKSKQESECGAFQRVAISFFAAVSPASNALFLSRVKPNLHKSFKISVAGEQGNVILNTLERLKATSSKIQPLGYTPKTYENKCQPLWMDRKYT